MRVLNSECIKPVHRELMLNVLRISNEFLLFSSWFKHMQLQHSFCVFLLGSGHLIFIGVGLGGKFASDILPKKKFVSDQ